jgi:hypothetical protein
MGGSSHPFRPMEVVRPPPNGKMVVAEITPKGLGGRATVVSFKIPASVRIVCNIVCLCKCEVESTGKCIAKINFYSN